MDHESIARRLDGLADDTRNEHARYREAMTYRDGRADGLEQAARAVREMAESNTESQSKGQDPATEVLDFRGVIEGMRRACLLRKETEPHEVVEHLRRVADSYAHDDYDRQTLREIEGMFEAVGPDLVEAIRVLRNTESKSITQAADDPA